ncbi:Lipase 5 [Penicillium diatomitis]|uniref:Patatin-like phospholipase domain-containing protein n=1 Tax=Penicillium diatomitis TaxID=2819901 RepID=A0A9W9X1Q9_9EURO|nr:Lipase 5 [Penicillium diatomitis]KAJ5480763.1 Lipase 5 [Penicillium diatomitis]
MRTSAMSMLGDSTIIQPPCQKSDSDSVISFASPPSRSLTKSISIPSISSVVKGSLNWAGQTLHSFRDGLSAEERRRKADIENRKEVLYLQIKHAVSYEEWSATASELDRLEDNIAWKRTTECTEYNAELVQGRLRQLDEARISCDVSRMLFLVRTALSRDLGNMNNASLYRHSHTGTKDLIDQYITAALDTIDTLVDLSAHGRCDGLELKYILDQLLAARQAFGRSALLFSGGATFGMTHIGVLKALYESKLIPRIISGASAGSIVCAVFCTRTDDELPALLETYAHGNFAVFNEQGQEENIFQKTARFFKYGSFLEIDHLANTMRAWLGDITFQEAYNRTRRILNICVSSAGTYELPRLLNYISAPNVLIWSAVAVSCSVPFVFRPYTLMAKDPLTGEATPWNDLHRQYIDGSVDGDLPMTRLSEMFNVNHFIVSQVNPHVVPFLPKENGPIISSEPSKSFIPQWMNTMTHLAKDEVLHRMTVLSEMGVFSTSMTKAASIINQKYSGDINIYPELISSNFPRILENPTTDFMLQACLNGERATWPRLSRIRNACAIELALDRAVQQMRARVTFCPSRAGLYTDSYIRQSVQSLDNGNGRGRLTDRRLGSSKTELHKRRMKLLPRSVTAPALRKARSTVSLEHAAPPTSALARPPTQRRRSSTAITNRAFTFDSSSEEEDEDGGLHRHYSPYRRGEHSTNGTESKNERRSSVQTRRPSISSTRRRRSASDRQASPTAVYSAMAREVSLALSPSSRHQLNMTPSMKISSSEQLQPRVNI